MTTHVLERTQVIDKPLAEVFPFFADAANLQRITPKFLHFRIITPGSIEMRVGTRIDYELSLFGVPLRWRTRITEFVPGVRFVDEQESGPYALWRHTHTADGCRAWMTAPWWAPAYLLVLGIALRRIAQLASKPDA